jgi:uncharacterized protein (UPF0332 family)
MKPELAPRELGRALQKAFQMRCDADYGNLASPSREETRELLDAAHKFATAIAQLLGR